MTLERGLRRLVVVLSVVVMAVGVAADALLSPGPSWKVSLALRDGRTAILRLSWINSSAHDRTEVAKELTRVMRCAAGESERIACLSFQDEVVSLPPVPPQRVPGTSRSLVRSPDGKLVIVDTPAGASRAEIIALAKQGASRDIMPAITEGDIADMRVVPEWSWRSWRAVVFTTAALGLVVLLWLGFFALRWVARGFVSHT